VQLKLPLYGVINEVSKADWELTEPSQHEGFFMEINELDQFLRFDFEYQVPSSISDSSASLSCFGHPRGISGFTLGGDI